ncbi:MAG: hypothetical protein QF662_04050 [Phycisphaerae bacterium]|nr:hypothetical protein [Phycisphaerae bacterium]
MPAAKIGKLALKKDYDYSKVLFNVSAGRGGRAPASSKKGTGTSRIVEKIRYAYIEAYELSFCPQLHFISSDKPRLALRKEAEENKYGFILEAALSGFKVVGKNKRIEYRLAQQMLVRTKAGWKTLFQQKQAGPALSTSEMDMAFGFGILRNPVEIPFSTAMLPMSVANAAHDETTKTYSVILKVQNKLPFKVENLVPYISLPSRTTKGKTALLVLTKTGVVSIEPGATGKVKASIKEDSLKKKGVFWRPVGVIARSIKLNVEAPTPDADKKDGEQAGK